MSMPISRVVVATAVAGREGSRRHSAASLARDAAVDPEIRRRTLGHADAAMTSHYTHIEAEAHKAAAESVAKFVEAASS
jgi:integrase